MIDGELPALDDDVWELYGPDDWTQAHDLAAEQPEKLAELQRLFLIEAAKYNVLPLDDRRVERFNADIAGRPQLVRGNSQLLFGGMGRLTENSVVKIKNKSHAVTAEIDVPEGGAAGRDRRPGRRLRRLEPLRQGRQAGLLLQLLRPAAVQGVRRRRAPAGRAPGAHGVRLRRRRARQGRDVALYLDGEKVGKGRVDGTVPMVFSADETTDVGSDSGTPVSDDYAAGSEFTGRVRWVQIDLGEDAEDADHLISPEERLRIAMARQ